MTNVSPTTVEATVIRYKRRFSDHWSGKNDQFWFAHLIAAIGDLSHSFLDTYSNKFELELTIIAAICMNWLEKLDKEK
jgi:hypothetical protein